MCLAAEPINSNLAIGAGNCNEKSTIRDAPFAIQNDYKQFVSTYSDSMSTCKCSTNTLAYYLRKRFKLDIGVPVTGMEARGRGVARVEIPFGTAGFYTINHS